MAKGKKSGKSKKPARARADSGGNGVGHNVGGSVIPKKELKAAFDELDREFDAKETANAEHMANIKGIYERHADRMGVPKSILRDIYQEHRHQVKRADRLRDLDDVKRHDHDRLMAAASGFGNTPFGRYAKALADEAENEPDALGEALASETPK